MTKLNDNDLELMHDEFLDECCGSVKIAGLTYNTSQALVSVDPVTYRESYKNWLDGQLSDEVIFQAGDDNYFTDKNDALEWFLDENKVDMLIVLKTIVKEVQSDLKSNPKEYTESGCEEPSIDIRLCVDLGYNASWIFRTGLVDYDQMHSEYCSALSIQSDTDASKLLESLIKQLGE